MRSFVDRLEDRRLLSAGALDDRFGGSGQVTRPYGDQLAGIADFAVDRSGSVLVAVGSTPTPLVDRTYELLRYRRDGTLDQAFAGTHITDHHPRGIDGSPRPAARGTRVTTAPTSSGC
jgi:hypothetical protein